LGDMYYIRDPRTANSLAVDCRKKQVRYHAGPDDLLAAPSNDGIELRLAKANPATGATSGSSSGFSAYLM